MENNNQENIIKYMSMDKGEIVQLAGQLKKLGYTVEVTEETLSVYKDDLGIEYFENLNNVMKDRKYVRQNVGQYVAYKNYKESVRLGADEFEVSDPPYNEEDTKEFIKTLEAAGVTRFFFTAKTTITIDFLTVCAELWWYNIHTGYMHRSNEISGYKCFG